MKRFWSKRKYWLLGVLGLSFFLAVPVSHQLEQNDKFCISCHTIPEETYYQRSLMVLEEPPNVLDLASVHYIKEKNFKCIDCHGGTGTIQDQITTFNLGVKDAFKFIVGDVDPTIQKLSTGSPTLVDSSCQSCHAASLLVVGFNNHFHNLLPAARYAWEAGGELTSPPELLVADLLNLETSETTVLCIDCHQGHNFFSGNDQHQFVDIQNFVIPSCVVCHREIDKGPQKEEELGG